MTPNPKDDFISEQDCDNGFYDCMENEDIDNATEYYESIKHIVRQQTAQEIRGLVDKCVSHVSIAEDSAFCRCGHCELKKEIKKRYLGDE